MARRRTNSLGKPSRIVRLADWKASEKGIDEFTSGVYPMGASVRCVRVASRAEKQLRTVPKHIRNGLRVWIAMVQGDGLEVVRRIRGFHDEPLRGHRTGQRSIRLSRSYRAIYEVKGDTARFVSIEEVSKHDC